MKLPSDMADFFMETLDNKSGVARESVETAVTDCLTKEGFAKFKCRVLNTFVSRVEGKRRSTLVYKRFMKKYKDFFAGLLLSGEIEFEKEDKG